MKLCICKFFSEIEPSFIEFAKKIKRNSNDFYISTVFENEPYEEYYSELKNTVDYCVIKSPKTRNQIIDKVFSVTSSDWMLLLDSKEYIETDALENVSLSGSAYALPVVFLSEIYRSTSYEIKLISKNYTYGDKVEIFPLTIYKKSGFNDEDIENKLDFTKNLYEMYNLDLLKASFADLLSLNENPALAIRLYKIILNDCNDKDLRFKVLINIALNYIILELPDKVPDILGEVVKSGYSSVLLNSLLCIIETDPSKKEYYSKLVFEATTENWFDDLQFRKYYNEAILIQENFNNNIKDKIQRYKKAYFYEPENTEILDNLFELVLQDKNYFDISERNEISVVIPSFNNFAYLMRTIKTLIVNTECKLEIIVVEDGEISDFANEFYKNNSWIKVIKNHVNSGYIKSVNKGVSYANGDYLLILNDDVFILPHSIDNLLKILKNSPDTAIVGPVNNDLMIDVSKRLNSLCKLTYEIVSVDEIESFENSLLLFDSFFELYSFSESNRKKFADSFCYSNSITGFCFLISSKIAKEVSINGNLLDEYYGFGYYDDFDLCEKVKRSGYRLKIAKESIVYHFGSVSTKKNKFRIDRITKRNQKRFLKKWFPEIGIRKYENSLCIFCDNIDNLEETINIAENEYDEIVIVTKTFDNTIISLTEKYGAELFVSDWNNITDPESYCSGLVTGNNFSWIIT